MATINVYNENSPDVKLGSERDKASSSLAHSENSHGIKDGIVSSNSNKVLDSLNRGKSSKSNLALTNRAKIRKNSENNFVEHSSNSAGNFPSDKPTDNSSTINLVNSGGRVDISKNNPLAKEGLSSNLLNLGSNASEDASPIRLASNVAQNAVLTKKSIRNNTKTFNKSLGKQKKEYSNKVVALNQKKYLNDKVRLSGKRNISSDFQKTKDKLIKSKSVKNVKSVASGIGGGFASVFGESDELKEVDSAYNKGRSTIYGARKLKAIKNGKTIRSARAAKKAKAAKTAALNVSRKAKASAKAGTAAKSGVAIGGTAAGAPLLIVLLVVAAVVILVAIINGILAAVLGSQHGSLEGDQAVIAQTLADKGYNNAQIAGIMSNIYKESAYNSKIFQADHCEYDYLSEQQKMIAGGYGLCQWDNRKAGLCVFCDVRGRAHSDIEAQCWYIDEELKGGVWSSGRADAYEGYYYWSVEQWLSTPSDRANVASLSQTFTWQWERCSASAYAGRWPDQLSEAYRIFDALEGGMLDVVGRARAEIGKPYVWGAAGPDGYDCSGLVSYALTGQHAHLWTTYDFMTWPQTDNPMPGDICTTSEHCGIYLGNGQMIHAPQPGENVKIGPVQAGMIFVKKPG